VSLVFKENRVLKVFKVFKVQQVPKVLPVFKVLHLQVVHLDKYYIIMVVLQLVMLV
jgi:hypothetical protein